MIAPLHENVSETELISLMDFITDRYFGQTLTPKQLSNAIADWERLQDEQ